MSSYVKPDEILNIFNINNYFYNQQTVDIELGNELYYQRNGRIVQTRADWGGGIAIANGAICTRATTGSSTWCLERANTSSDASINFYTASTLSYRLGINTTPFASPTGVFSLFNSSNARIAFFDPTGNLNIQGTLTQVSDRDKKTDINDTKLGLQFVEQLQPKSYRMKTDDETSPLRHGLIYQELEQLINEQGISFSGVTEHEGEKGISYTELIAPMIKSIQELSQQVKQLQQEISTLKEN